MSVSQVRIPASKVLYHEECSPRKQKESLVFETAKGAIDQAGNALKERESESDSIDLDRVITQETPVSLISADLEAGGAIKGVKEIFTIAREQKDVKSSENSVRKKIKTRTSISIPRERSDSAQSPRLSSNENRIRQGIIIQRKLNNIYDCLVRIVFYPGLELAFNHEGSLCARSLENEEASSEEIHKIIEYIYMVINRAISSNVSIFFNSDGHIITLKMIDSMIGKKYSDCNRPLINDIKRMLEEYVEENQDFVSKLLLEDEPKYISRLSRLKLPRATRKKFSKEELVFVKLLQRIYPVSDAKITSGEDGVLPVVPFNLMVSLYKKHMDANQLCRIASHLLNLPEKYMPYLQKLYLFGLLGRIESMERLRKLPDIELLEEYADPQLFRLCSELNLNLKKEDVLSYYKHSGISASGEFARYSAIGKTDAEELENGIERIVLDLKGAAASLFCDLDYHRCLEIIKLNGTGDITDYYNNLTHFFKKQLIGSLNDKKSIKIFYRKYLLFHRICDAALSNHDFFSSFGIYCALQTSKVVNALKLVKSPKLSGEMATIHERLRQTFSATGNFANLNHQFYECVKNRVFYIPPFQLLLHRIEHRRQEIQSLPAKEGLFDFEKLDVESYEMASINLIFDQVRYNFEHLKHVIYTDIVYSIYSSTV
jgi:hypothetical protein